MNAVQLSGILNGAQLNGVLNGVHLLLNAELNAGSTENAELNAELNAKFLLNAELNAERRKMLNDSYSVNSSLGKCPPTRF